VARAQRLVELGELNGRNGDEFAARDFFDQALAALTAQEHARDGMPIGTMLDAMRATLTGISGMKPGESPAEVFVVVRGLLSRVHLGLARVFKTQDAAKSAQHLTMADQLDGRDDGDAMDEARKMMAELQQQMAELAGKIAN
jgi:hypothetical protein